MSINIKILDIFSKSVPAICEKDNPLWPIVYPQMQKLFNIWKSLSFTILRNKIIYNKGQIISIDAGKLFDKI